MRRIKFKELKEIIKYCQEKNVLLKISGIIRTNINIEKAHIEIINNEFIIRINQEMNIIVDINWIANFYTNNDNTIIKLEFDNLGRVELYIK